MLVLVLENRKINLDSSNMDPPPNQSFGLSPFQIAGNTRVFFLCSFMAPNSTVLLHWDPTHKKHTNKTYILSFGEDKKCIGLSFLIIG